MTVARERILDAAYDLFSRRGIRAVRDSTPIIEHSGVARMTLYRHFGSKDELVLAFLERREQRWTRDWLQREVEERTADPAERLLAIFDVFDGWFRQPDFEGCSFINVLLEIADPASDLHRASRTTWPGSATSSKASRRTRAWPIPRSSPASGTS